jgi:hypothetical protein
LKAIDIKAAQIERISSRKDHSISFGVGTPELTPDQAAAFLGLHGANVRMMIQPLDVEADALVEVKTELEAKTQAQRIRACIFVLWKQEGKKGDFEDFYRKQTEKIIDWLKQKLEPVL